jgi:predicted DNA-binding transcriptional regulator AlpA
MDEHQEANEIAAQLRSAKHSANDFSNLPGHAYLDIRVVAELFNAGESTVWRWVQEEIFPKPVRIGLKWTRWQVSDIRDHMKKIHREK